MNRAFAEKNLIGKLLVMFLVPACTSVASTDLKTAGMSAHITVNADGTGASQASTQLNVDTNATDFVSLSSGDTLTAKAGTQSQNMTGTTILGAITYNAAFQGEEAANTQYTVSLTRASGNTSAPSSTVTLPAPFTITPPATTTYSRASNDIVVAYGPSGQTDPVTWQIAGSCIVATGGTLTNDPGTLTVAHSSLTTPGGSSSASTSCQLTLTITRTRAGTLDTAYQGGSISATQTRALTVQSTP